ncbi:MAG: hypothetical protein IK082_01745 [Oscillospiraceae bacterium]|nr:hypothetical protein [Oscillospiraceae bacterium]
MSELPVPEIPESPLPEPEVPAAEDFSEAVPEKLPEEASVETRESVPEEAIPDTPSGGSAAVSLLAGLVGCAVGTLLCAAGGGMTSTLGRFLFLLIPLAVGAADLLFRGDRGVPGLVITAVFTALGVFLVPSLTAAAVTAKTQGLSVFSVPLIALSRIGTANWFTDFAFDTAHVFPVVFAVIGVLIAWELYRLKKN